MEQLYPHYRANLVPDGIYDALSLPPAGAERPYVAINMVTSIDGKITLGKEHQKRKLGSQLDRRLMVRLRAHFDAVLRGAETVRAGRRFPGVPEELARLRARQGKPEQPLAVVISGSLDLPLDSEFFAVKERVLVMTAEAADPRRRREVEKRAALEVVGESRVDLVQALRLLRERYGIRRLLVEGGARVNYAFVEEGCLDSLFCTLAPKLSGFSEDLTMIEGPALLEPTPRFTLRTLYHHEDELFFHWERR